MDNTGTIEDPFLVQTYGKELLEKVAGLLAKSKEHGIRITTAESLTGGGIANLLTALGGSSSMLDGGFVVYNNEKKIKYLGVSEDDLRIHEAVSEPVAKQMAIGALKNSDAQLAIAVTGYAGDYGDEIRDIKGGTVFIGSAYRQDERDAPKLFEVTEHHFTPKRTDCRRETIAEAINVLERAMEHLLERPRIYSAHDENLHESFAKNGIKYGISVGRRQPIHVAHIDCIREIVAEGLHPVIITGSANPPESPLWNPLKNPMSPAMQEEQIDIAMKDAGIEDYTVINLPDQGGTNLPAWVASIKEKMAENGLDARKGVFHFREKAADVADAKKKGIKPLSSYTSYIRDGGIGVWQSSNPMVFFDNIDANPFRRMPIDSSDFDRLKVVLAVPDFVVKQVARARERNPHKDLLEDLPRTMADLVLQRLWVERGVITEEILDGKPVASLAELTEKIEAALQTPNANISGDLDAKGEGKEVTK